MLVNTQHVTSFPLPPPLRHCFDLGALVSAAGCAASCNIAQLQIRAWPSLLPERKCAETTGTCGHRKRNHISGSSTCISTSHLYHGHGSKEFCALKGWSGCEDISVTGNHLCRRIHPRRNPKPRSNEMFSWMSGGSGSEQSSGSKPRGIRWSAGPADSTFTPAKGIGAAEYYRGKLGRIEDNPHATPTGVARAARSSSAPPPPSDGSIEDVNYFLQQVHRTVQLRHQAMKFTVIMGNEAADLDSIACSIAYAHLLASKSCSNSPTNALTSCFVPLVNIPREDLALRTETLWLFQSSGLDIDSLVFTDDLDLQELYERNALQLILVDHNRLAAWQEGLASSIIEILDHHVDEGLYQHVPHRICQQVGSCSTLVAEKISEEAPELLRGRGLSKLMLAAILLDTGNFDAQTIRFSPLDETMAALLLNGAGHLGRNGFFDKLRERKFDQSSLSTTELLRRDYKQWTMGPGTSGVLGPKDKTTVVGISSLGLSLPALVAKDVDAASAIEGFRKERGAEVLLLMSAFYTGTDSKDSKFKRELAIISDDEALLKRLNKFLTGSSAGLSLKPSRVGGWEKEGSLPDGARTYNQGNKQASRKKIQPLLVEFFAN